jgi:hypothetical protein
LLCGDLQVGYFDLDLLYRGVSVTDEALAVLAAAARDRRTEILYDEVDLQLRKRYVHRMLLWPSGEADIVFSDLELACRARQDRSLPFVGDPFVEDGESEECLS